MYASGQAQDIIVACKKASAYSASNYLDAMKIAAIHLFLCFVMGKDTDPLQKLNLQFFFSLLVVVTDYIPSGKKNNNIVMSLMLRKAICMVAHTYYFNLSLPG